MNTRDYVNLLRYSRGRARTVYEYMFAHGISVSVCTDTHVQIMLGAERVKMIARCACARLRVYANRAHM